MKRILGSSCLLILLAASGFAAGKGPEIQIIDGKVSIQADSVTLSRFLHLLDAATGMTSKVSPEFANQKITVRISDMDLDTAIRKSFQGQPWNYSVVPGKGINILDRAAAVTGTTGSISSSPIQSFTNDSQNNNPPPPMPLPPSANQSGPIPANGNQSAGAPNLPPAQGGAPTPPPLFAAPGTSLGGALPTTGK